MYVGASPYTRIYCPYRAVGNGNPIPQGQAPGLRYLTPLGFSNIGYWLLIKVIGYRLWVIETFGTGTLTLTS